MTPMNEVTRILSGIEAGDPHAAEQLLPLVYDELRKLAAQKLAQEQPGQTLRRQAAQFVVHQRQQLLGGVRVAPLDGVQDARGFTHRGHRVLGFGGSSARPSVRGAGDVQAPARIEPAERAGPFSTRGRRR